MFIYIIYKIYKKYKNIYKIVDGDKWNITER